MRPALDFIIALSNHTIPQKYPGNPQRFPGYRIYKAVHRLLVMLFLSEEYLDRTAYEVEVRAELVLQEAAVRLTDVLRQVAEECE